jgi:hypothetical protein
MPERTVLININTALPKQMTQLPGIAKDLAYRIASHRKRHGYFTHWEELLQVRGFPDRVLPELKHRARLLPIPGVQPEELGPRRMKQGHLERAAKRPKGYTRAIRATRGSDRLKRAA